MPHFGYVTLTMSALSPPLSPVFLRHLRAVELERDVGAPIRGEEVPLWGHVADPPAELVPGTVLDACAQPRGYLRVELVLRRGSGDRGGRRRAWGGFACDHRLDRRTAREREGGREGERGERDEPGSASLQMRIPGAG